MQGKAAVALRQEVHPALCELLVVEEDEEGVEEDHGYCEEAGDDIEGLRDDRPYLGHALLDGVDETFLGDEGLDVGFGQVLVQEVLYDVGDILQVHVIGDEYLEQVLCTAYFLDDGRDGYHKEESGDQCYGEEGGEDGHDAEAHAAAELEELNQWKQQVGDEPGQKEG